GTIYLFQPLGEGRRAQVSKITRPDGTELLFEYGAGPALRSVTSSRGYALLLEGGSLISKACILNLSIVARPADNACPADAQATAAYTYSSATGTTRLASFTDPGGAVWSFTYDNSSGAIVMGFVKPIPPGQPGHSEPWLTNSLGTAFDVDSRPYEIVWVQDFADGQRYTYGFFTPPLVNTIAGGSFTNILGQRTTLTYDFPYLPGSGPGDACQSPPCNNDQPISNESPGYTRQHTSGPAWITDPLERTTILDYCDPVAMAGLTYPPFVNKCYVGPLYSFTDPGGIQTFLKYDFSQNIVEARRRAKPVNGQPSPLSDIVASASYACASLNLKTCAKPEWTRDANGNRTDYTYAPEHGGVLTETGPAPTPNAPRPQKRFTYAQRHAWISNGSGGYVQAATAVWLLTQESFCRTSAA
ncbi:MAG: hypothetical protein ACREX8_10990, partial [Gammaproteobacteria bacterium]